MLGLEWSSRTWSCKAKSDDEHEMARKKEAHAELPFSTKPYQNTGDPVKYQETTRIKNKHFKKAEREMSRIPRASFNNVSTHVTSVAFSPHVDLTQQHETKES
ncbi:hypothetical protein NC653_002765 [Populus alba x Populus x berolinensis]|uniref:Uncharacterized protein n=1 Tax=Populus alba x Populus x berolinensis TaxID=444605 RepID=A0AAD6RRF5_9ROSI|nr:hypothetical protein NC653_002765 [Populus alba x Populus x berolinensis]